MNAASVTAGNSATSRITPRDRRFAREQKPGRWWHGGDPVRDRLLQCAVGDLPQGRGLFRRERAQSSRRRSGQAGRGDQGFTTQEVIHSREHAAFNKAALDAGYDLGAAGGAGRSWRLDFIRSKPPIASLAATMALEHFTAILAHELLADPRHLGGAEPEAAGAVALALRSRRSSIRASPTTPGSTRPATGRGPSAGRSRPR